MNAHCTHLAVVVQSSVCVCVYICIYMNTCVYMYAYVCVLASPRGVQYLSPPIRAQTHALCSESAVS